MRILLICQDRLGTSMAGPAIRAYEFATRLAPSNHVTLLLTQSTDSPVSLDGVEVVHRESPPLRWLRDLASDHDVVLSQPLRMQQMHALARSTATVVYDLYAPAPVELLALSMHETQTSRRHRAATCVTAQLEYDAAVASADGLICASETQRTFVLGALASNRQIDLTRYCADPSLRSMVTVVPFGMPEQGPAGDAHPIRDSVADADDLVLLWSGGIWNWLDPITVIDAVDRARRSVPDLRLVFMGLHHPNPEIRMAMTERAVRRADDLGLTGSNVHFNHGWVPYDERSAYLTDADVGICAHFDALETRLAFRQRIVDHIWAELPTLSTRGDDLSELVDRRGAGRALDFGDVDGWADAIVSIAGDRSLLADMRRATIELQGQFRWTSIVRSLEEYLTSVAATESRPSFGLAPRLPRYTWVQGRRQGVQPALRKIARSFRR